MPGDELKFNLSRIICAECRYDYTVHTVRGLFECVNHKRCYICAKTDVISAGREQVKEIVGSGGKPLCHCDQCGKYLVFRYRGGGGYRAPIFTSVSKLHEHGVWLQRQPRNCDHCIAVFRSHQKYVKHSERYMCHDV
jgi:hypothetical protein